MFPSSSRRSRARGPGPLCVRGQRRAPAATSHCGLTVRCRGRSSSLNRSRTGTPLAARSEISSAPASLRFSCGSPARRRRRPGCQDRAPGAGAAAAAAVLQAASPPTSTCQMLLTLSLTSSTSSSVEGTLSNWGVEQHLCDRIFFYCRTESRCLQGSQALLIGEQEGAQSQGGPGPVSHLPSRRLPASRAAPGRQCQVQFVCGLGLVPHAAKLRALDSRVLRRSREGL